MDSIFRNRREGWYQTFCGSSDSRKSAGHDPYFANGGQVYPQGYRLEKEDTGSYEKEFMVSVDGEEPVSMYIQVPEKELEEQEEEPKQNKKLTRKEQAQKSIAEAVSRYNEQRSDPDYYYLPDKLNGKR